MYRSLRPSCAALVMLASALLSVFFGTVIARAQVEGEAWSPPKELFREEPGEYTNELWLLRDPSDRLYLWWPLFPDSQTPLTPDQILDASAVFHTEWRDGHWQEPRDVLVWPNAGPNLTSAVIDSRGVIHAFSPTDCLSYISVLHDKAMDPRAWSERTCVDSMGSSNVAVAIDRNDVLYLAYAAPGSKAIRVASSVDGGLDWTTVEVATTQDYDGPSNGYFTAPDLSIDERGRLHLVWSPTSPPDGYPYLGVLYSRSDDGGLTWTEPMQLGQEREGQPAIAVHGDDVHVLWNGDAAKGGRYYRYSNDAGNTWKPVEKLGDGGGLQRPPALIVDNNGNLHAMLHEQESLYYIAKINNRWIAKTAVYSPNQQNAQEVFTIRLAITGGTQLHALYTLLTSDKGRVVFHQQREIDARPETPVPWAASTPISTPIPLSISTVSPSIPTALPTPAILKHDVPTQASKTSQSVPVVIGASAALMLVLGTAIMVGARRRQ